MSSKKWLDLSEFGVDVLVGEKDGKRLAIFVPLTGSFSKEMTEKFEAQGFKPFYDGSEVVFTLDTSPSGKVLKNIFPDISNKSVKFLSTPEEEAKVVFRGELMPYTPPVAAEPSPAPEIAPEFADIDVSMFSPEEPDAAAEIAEKAPEPAEKEEVAVKVEPVPAPPSDEPEAPEEAPQAPMTFPKGFDDFEAFMIFEGVPQDIRKKHMDAISEMHRIYGHDRLFGETWDTGKLRKDFANETPRKDLAKSKIIDGAYPFACQYLRTSEEERQTFREFAETSAADMDTFIQVFEAAVNDTDADMNVTNLLNSYTRNMHLSGVRVVMNMILTTEPRAFDKDIKENDYRFAVLAEKGAQFANFKSPLISKIRQCTARVEQLRQTWAEINPEPPRTPAP